MTGEFSKPFKILSLDGGGIRGVISAQILQEVEKQIWELKNQKLHEYFDMIAGTSTGSILAAGIAMGKPSSELLDIYKKWGMKIFPYQKLLRWERLPLIFKYGLSAPKFSNDGLIEALKYNLTKEGKEVPIKDIGTPTQIPNARKPTLLIPAYDTWYRNTTFFTNSHPKTFADPPDNPPSTWGQLWYDDTPLWKICVSSSSAPTFFPGYELTDETEVTSKNQWRFPHVDGGVSANNPSLCAISHAINHNLSKFEDIAVLSIGTGETTEPYSTKDIEGWGLTQWARRIAPVFMGGQGAVNSQVCEQLMGGLEGKRYLRLQFELNEKFNRNEVKDSEAPYELLKKKYRKNEFTGKPVSEAIDDARPENIDQLIKTAKAFLEEKEGCCYRTRNQKGIPVKDAIRHFIKKNP
jgi:hypothetical protein